MKANEIGHHIAKLRQMRGWSQDRMVAKIQCLPGGEFYEMTRQMLANIESRRTRASEWHIRAIHTVLGCAYEDIYHGPKARPAKPPAQVPAHVPRQPVLRRPSCPRPFSARSIHRRRASS